jgi:hypothetical protein
VTAEPGESVTAEPRTRLSPSAPLSCHSCSPLLAIVLADDDRHRSVECRDHSRAGHWPPKPCPYSSGARISCAARSVSLHLTLPGLAHTGGIGSRAVSGPPYHTAVTQRRPLAYPHPVIRRAHFCLWEFLRHCMPARDGLWREALPRLPDLPCTPDQGELHSITSFPQCQRLLTCTCTQPVRRGQADMQAM